VWWALQTLTTNLVFTIESISERILKIWLRFDQFFSYEFGVFLFWDTVYNSMYCTCIRESSEIIRLTEQVDFDILRSNNEV